MAETKKLSKSDVRKSFWLWATFSHSCYNYERLQGTGIAIAMGPILKKLYTKKEDIAAGLKRHLAFFNTEPNVGAIVPGIAVAMEEERANGAPITDEAISSIKTGLMGPLAGVGDTITQGIITPLFLSICISLATEGNLSGPILYVIAISAAILGIAYFMFMQGYTLGKKAIEKILEGGVLNKIISIAGIVGCMVLGALTAQYVSLSTPIQFKTGAETALKLQADVFDKILPGLLPLILTLVTLYLVRKGKSSTTIMFILIVLGLVGGLIGLF